MASLQQLKNRISGKSNNKENLDSKNKTIKDKNLSLNTPSVSILL